VLPEWSDAARIGHRSVFSDFGKTTLAIDEIRIYASYLITYYEPARILITKFDQKKTAHPETTK
jgi:hypothetical protein